MLSKRLSYNLQTAFCLLQQLHFAYAVIMTFFGCKGMTIGNNSEDNAFPDFFLFIYYCTTLVLCIINMHFTAERANEKNQSYAINS